MTRAHTAAEPASPSTAWLPRARDLVRRALSSTIRVPGEVLVLQLRAPPLPLEVALRALHHVVDDAADVVWDPPSGPAFVGVGVAGKVGRAQDLAGVRVEAEALWSRVRPLSLDDEGPPARLFGGLAFVRAGQSARGASADPWRDFGDGAFRLPRHRYAREAGRAWLAVALDDERVGDPVRPLEEEIDAVLAALDAATRLHVPEPRAAGPATLLVEQLAPSSWQAVVDNALAGIHAGRFEKVVAARRADVRSDRPFDHVGVLERLQESALACTRFAFRVGASTFLGASPERLVTRRGPVVLSEALAGSIGAGRAEGSAELLASAKDLGEHAVVVREITRHLAPRCVELDVPARPRVRALRHVLHLHTPIEGRLREPTHVLDLVAALHPTPAVGGVPQEDALAWIIEHEPVPRGWYAGPIGWFDADGDGEFVVALRSAVIRGELAWLWAGAGIVADSTPSSEYAETALKQRAMLDALGAGP